MSVYPNNPLTLGQVGFNPYIQQQPAYNQPYIPQTQTMMQVQSPRMEIQRVNGKDSAFAFAIGPNSSVILADATNPKIWVVTTDSSGFKAVTGYKIIPDDEEEPKEPATDDRYEALSERLTKLEERMNSYGQSNYRAAGQNKPGNANAQPNDRNSQSVKEPNGGC